MLIGSSLWKDREHYLNKMTLAELVRAYFSYPAIQAYLILAVVSCSLSLYLAQDAASLAGAVIAAIVIYPAVWYVLHRYVLHGRFLYKSPRTAALWKRIHFDHHQDPNNLRVLFGALPTTLPTILWITAPIGWLIGGLPGSLMAFATGCIITCFYEFCHCIQHLAYAPKWEFLKRMKKYHLAHHFHNEQGNFGITNFVCDHLFSTFYGETHEMPRSPTVFNLGYTGEEIERYPWVASMSDMKKKEPRMPAAQTPEAKNAGA